METKPDIESAVIIQWPSRGYVAHLRFTDKKLDIDISHGSKPVLHHLIESYFYKKMGLRNAQY